MTRTLPFASVVIPTKDRTSLLKDSVRSVIAQSYPHELLEVVVVDDSTVKGSAERAIEELKAQARVPLHYVTRGGGGVNHARNEGIEFSNGDVIIFVDDDIEAPAGWLAALLNGWQRLDRPQCVGGPIRLRLEGIPPSVCSACGDIEWGTRLEAPPGSDAVGFVYSANMAVVRTAFDDVGPFDERLRPGGDEVEWQMRLKERGGTIGFVPDAWLWHRRLQSDLTPYSVVRAKFHRAANSAYFDKLVGNPTQKLLHLAPISLGHAIRRRCWNGLFMVAGEIGNDMGLLRYAREESRHA